MTERPKPNGEELEAGLDAAELPLLDGGEERALSEALAAAWRPAPLDEARHERILEVALEDPFAPPSEEELVESDRLRRALSGEGSHPEAALAEALRAASRGPSEAAIERALERAEPSKKPGSGGAGGRGTVVYAAFGGAGAALALAAAVALLVLPSGKREAPRRAPVAASAVSPAGTSGLALSRTTAPLFEGSDFETAASTARMDRISSVRARDLRRNRYALWGVR